MAALDYPASPAHSHAVPQSLVPSSHQPISSSACHTPSPPTSGIAASHSVPNSHSRSPASLSNKLRLDLPHAPCHQKLPEAKSVPGYLLHAASHTSESVLDRPQGTRTHSPLSPTLCPPYLPTLIHPLPSITMPGQSRQDAACDSSLTTNTGSETAVAALMRLYDSRQLRR